MLNKQELKNNIEKVADEQKKSVLDVITTLQAVAAKTQTDEILLSALCEIKMDYINVDQLLGLA